MPIYEYRCSQCNEVFEAFQGINDDSLKECRMCGASSVGRTISPPAIHFRGKGWYVTDYKDKKEPASKDRAAKETKK